MLCFVLLGVAVALASACGEESRSPTDDLRVGEVAILEVNAIPETGAPYWVEVVNLRDTPAPLGNCTLDDYRGSWKKNVLLGAPIEGGRLAVLAGDCGRVTTMAACLEASALRLSASGNPRIRIACPDPERPWQSATVDEAWYDAEVAGMASGRTLSVPPAVAAAQAAGENDEPEGWCVSEPTPGAANLCIE